MYFREGMRKSSTVPLRTNQNSAILVPCVNCEEFIPSDQIDDHARKCTQVSMRVQQIHNSDNPFDENDYKLTNLKINIQQKSYKFRDQLCQLIDQVISVKDVGYIEEHNLANYEKELQILRQQPLSSINQTLHIERLNSIVLQRMQTMRKYLQKQKMKCSQTQQNFYSAPLSSNKSQSKVSLNSTKTSQLKQQINEKLEQCHKMRIETQMYQTNIENINKSLLKKSQYFSPDARLTLITKFSSSNKQITHDPQKSEILTHITNTQDEQQIFDLPTPQNATQRQFYTLCLNIKMRYPRASPAQKLPVTILWLEAQKLQLTQEKWEAFLIDAMDHPYSYLDPKKVNANMQFQNKLTQKCCEGTTPYGFTFTGAYTFGESQRTQWAKPEDDPVCCEHFKNRFYQAELFQSQKSFCRKTNLPKDERLKAVSSPNPPVGTYNIHKVVVVDEESIKYSQTKENPEKLKQRFTIQSSMGKYKSNGELDDHPDWPKATGVPDKENPIGPTSYNPKKLGKTQPLISFGYKEEHQWARDGPAPDKYYNSDTFSQFRTTSSWKGFQKKRKGFGGAQKLILPKSIDIGPGQYPTQEFEAGAMISFPKSEREFFKTNKVPAPGTYSNQADNIEKRILQTQKDEMKRRDKKLENENKERKEEELRQRKAEELGRVYILKNQRSNLAQYSNPAPGAYDPTLPSPVKNVLMPKDKRKNMVQKEDIAKPGPGQYNQELLPQKLSFNLTGNAQGKSERPDPNSETKLMKYRVPSPTSYEHKSSLNGPKYSMRLKNERYNINANPGPGQYEPDHNLSVPDPNDKPPYHYTVPYTPTPHMGKSNRSNPVLSKYKNIGPGSYQCSTASSGSRMSMPKAARFPVSEMDDVGPGSYKIPSSIGLIPKYHFEKYKERIDPTTLHQFDKK